MNAIFAFVMVVCGTYIGLGLLPGMNATTRTITTPTYSLAVVGLATGVVLVFTILVLFYLIKSLKDF